MSFVLRAEARIAEILEELEKETGQSVASIEIERTSVTLMNRETRTYRANVLIQMHPLPGPWAKG